MSHSLNRSGDVYLASLVEGNPIRVDARQRFMDKPVWVPATFLRWDVTPMWQGKYVPSPGISAFVCIDPPVQAPMLVPADELGMFHVGARHIEIPQVPVSDRISK